MASLSPPHPPFVEFGFYFADRPDHDALRSVIEALLDSGGRLTGRVYVHAKEDAGGPFGGPTDFEQEAVTVSGPADLERLQSEGYRLMRAEVAGATPHDETTFAIATFGRVPKPDRDTRHPVQVWFSGEDVDDYLRDPSQRRGRRAGEALSGLFEALVGLLAPSYAAISFERPLATPECFGEDPATAQDYPDFFLGRDYVGDERLAEAQRVLGDQATPVAHGLLVLSRPVFGAPEQADAVKAASELRKRVLSADQARRWSE